MEWVAAVVLACAGLAGGLWAWARHVEPRLFAPRHRGMPVRARTAGALPPPRQRANAGGKLPPGEEGHLAFAESLVVAAEMYRDECAERVR